MKTHDSLSKEELLIIFQLKVKIILVSRGCRWLYFSGFLHILYASAGASADSKEKTL